MPAVLPICKRIRLERRVIQRQKSPARIAHPHVVALIDEEIRRRTILVRNELGRCAEQPVAEEHNAWLGVGRRCIGSLRRHVVQFQNVAVFRCHKVDIDFVIISPNRVYLSR